jgi:hypothetical protein
VSLPAAALQPAPLLLPGARLLLRALRLLGRPLLWLRLLLRPLVLLLLNRALLFLGLPVLLGPLALLLLNRAMLLWLRLLLGLPLLRLLTSLRLLLCRLSRGSLLLLLLCLPGRLLRRCALLLLRSLLPLRLFLPGLRSTLFRLFLLLRRGPLLLLRLASLMAGWRFALLVPLLIGLRAYDYCGPEKQYGCGNTAYSNDLHHSLTPVRYTHVNSQPLRAECLRGKGHWRASNRTTSSFGERNAPMSFAIYVIGYLIVIGGLTYCAVLVHVPTHWIVAGAIVLAGLGIVTGVKATRQKDPAD